MSEYTHNHSLRCRHIHTAGHRCGSPALRGQHLCFYHHTTRRPPKPLGPQPDDAVFTLPSIEDSASIQHGVGEVLARIAVNSLDLQRGRLLLYGLRIAAQLLPRNRALAADALNHPDRLAGEIALIEDLIFDPDLGPLAPVANLDPPSSPVADAPTRPAWLQEFFDKAKELPARVPHPDPILNPDFYTDPARYGHPELAPFAEAARAAAAKPKRNP